MLLIVTVPFTMLFLNLLSVGVSRYIYQHLRRAKPAWQQVEISGLRLLWLTCVWQAGYLVLLLMVDAAIHLSMRQNELALHLLLLSAFLFPPILLWRHRQRSSQP